MFLLLLCGCQAAPREVFPAVRPALVWPRPPDVPRIRYIGELRGQESLGARPGGLAALRAIVAGPAPVGVFVRPAAVAVAGEVVFVADTGLGGVHRLDLERREYALLRGSETDPLRVPIDVEIVDGRELVVVDRGRGVLERFDVSGAWLRTQRLAGMSAPVSAAWDGARRTLWLADAGAHAVSAMGDRPPAGLIGGRGGGLGEFNFPTSVAVRSGLGLVVADAMNFRVQVFDEALRPALAFGQKGDAAGDFSLPRAVALDSDNNIHVLDNQFENVQVFNGQGRLLMAYGRGGAGRGEFSVPTGLTIDARDRIWIADSYNRRVQVFQYLAEGASGVD